MDAPQRPETSSRDDVDPLRGRDWRLVAAACARHRGMRNLTAVASWRRATRLPHSGHMDALDGVHGSIAAPGCCQGAVDRAAVTGL